MRCWRSNASRTMFGTTHARLSWSGPGCRRIGRTADGVPQQALGALGLALHVGRSHAQQGRQGEGVLHLRPLGPDERIVATPDTEMREGDPVD